MGSIKGRPKGRWGGKEGRRFAPPLLAPHLFHLSGRPVNANEVKQTAFVQLGLHPSQVAQPVMPHFSVPTATGLLKEHFANTGIYKQG
jgi:hypothetical protein